MTWIEWIINPKYCFKVLRLKWYRLSRTKEGRKKLYLKFWLLIKRNALIGSVILLTFQINNERNWRREAEKQFAKVDAENSFIRGVISMRNSDFQTFPLAWFEKIKKNNEWRFLDLNLKYEIDYNYKKTDVLGKSNEEVFGYEIGAIYSKGDLDVWQNAEREVIRIEPLVDGNDVLVYKYGRLSSTGDRISCGFVIPFNKVLKAIEAHEKRISE